jgi:hypothetical protein
MADAQAEEITLTCDIDGCGATLTGPERGVGSAPWKLGTHKYQVHGIRNPNGKPKAKGSAKPDPPADQPTSVAVVREIGSGARGTGKGVPSASDLANGLGRGVQILSVVAAAYAAETDPTLTNEAERDALVRELMLPPRAAVDIMEPLGNAFAGTSINKRYGRQIVDNVDAVASLGELGKMYFKWRRYFRVREERMAHTVAPGVTYHPPQSPPPAAQPAPPPAQQSAPPDGVHTPPEAQPAPAPPPVVTEPALAQQPSGPVEQHDVMGNPVAPMQGRVLTREDVENMRRGRG